MDLSIVIPIFNSSPLILPAVRHLRDFWDRQNITYEILFCDDASRDNSRRVLTQLAREHGFVRCLYHEMNEGLGAALRTLFAASQGKWILYLDIDVPFGVEPLPRVLAQLQQADIVVVSRYGQSRVTGVPLVRWLSSYFYYLLCRALFAVPVRDIGSGTVGIRREILADLKLSASGFDIHIEMFARAIRRGCRVKEINAPPSAFVPGSFVIWRHGPRVVLDTLKLWRRLAREQEPLAGVGS